MSTVPVVGQTFTFGVGLYQQADTRLLQAAPTIAAGDFQRSINGAAFGNLDNLPAVTPAAGRRVQIVISAAETTAAGAGGEIWVQWVDAVGAQWCDGWASLRVRTSELAEAGADGDTLETLSDQMDTVEDCTCGGGAIAFTYTVTSTATGLPIEGAEVWISTDAGGANVVWSGHTDAFGVARTAAGNLPMLDAGTYYFWTQMGGYDFTNPDVEVVS